MRSVAVTAELYSYIPVLVGELLRKRAWSTLLPVSMVFLDDGWPGQIFALQAFLSLDLSS